MKEASKASHKELRLLIAKTPVNVARIFNRHPHKADGRHTGRKEFGPYGLRDGKPQGVKQRRANVKKVALLRLMLSVPRLLPGPCLDNVGGASATGGSAARQE